MTTDKETKYVVCAVIIDNKKVYAAQRGSGEFKDKWEFPGGKIEAGETPEQALVREIREELDTEIKVNFHICRIQQEYPEFILEMECYACSVVSGDLILKEHESAKWLSQSDIYSVDWLPADKKLADLLAPTI